MLKNKLAYLKSVREALKTYDNEHDIIDLDLIRKIYDYTNHLDDLNDIELKELDDFIAENTISIEHLANIYLDKKGEDTLNIQLSRMIPIQVTKPQCNIKVIKGKENVLVGAMSQESKVKVLCKTRGKYQKAA